MFNNKLKSLDGELQGYPNLAAQLKELKNCFTNEIFVPKTANITGASASYGKYQKLGSLVFVYIYFVSGGSFAVAANATITLPITPLLRNGTYPFSAHDFKFSQAGASTTQACWMDASNGLVKPNAAIAANANNWVFSGFYLVE
jgi:hypothetical protein